MDFLTATDTYIALLLSRPDMLPITVLSLFFLTLARALPLVVLAPFFGAKNMPRAVRMMFAVSIVAIFLPQNIMLTKYNIAISTPFLGFMLKELMIGAVLGFLASVPFYAVQMAGTLIDHQRGASSLQVTDPTTQTQTGDIGLLYNYILLALFFALNGPALFLDGIATSYQIIPVDGLLNAALFTSKTPFVKMVLNLLQMMMTLSIQLAAPGLIGVLLTDMFLGIANRMAPQVQIVFLGISLKSWVGIALLTAAWALIFKVMGQEALDWVKQINRMIQSLEFYK